MATVRHRLQKRMVYWIFKESKKLMSAIIKWKIVPEEPTLDMTGMAGIARMQCWRNGEGAIVRPIWEAMLAAAPQPDMTPTKKIDAALDSVFSAGRLTLHFYANNKTINGMREAMRKIMADSYLDGSNDARKAASDEIKEILSGEPHH